jgi:hypothetical protein
MCNMIRDVIEHSKSPAATHLSKECTRQIRHAISRHGGRDEEVMDLIKVAALITKAMITGTQLHNRGEKLSAQPFLLHRNDGSQRLTDSASRV